MDEAVGWRNSQKVRQEYDLPELGYCIWLSGKPGEAIAFLIQAIAVNPQNVMAHTELVARLERVNSELKQCRLSAGWHN